MLDVVALKKSLTLFKEYNTYVFVQTDANIYNGYVVQILDDAFIFMDDIIDAPFPISFDSVKYPIKPSTKKGKDFNFGREF
jgi:hypothetical protein